jgi:dTDP-4-amino-4,6-dideoxygalactose transaminase
MIINFKKWLRIEFGFDPHMGGNEQKYVQSFDSNWIAPMGPNLTIFEENLENI